MAITGDATTNEVKVTVSGVLPSVENNDPIGDLANSQRLTQQQIIPSAIQNRFINIVTQSPKPQTPTSITSDDLATSFATVSGDPSTGFAPYALFGFGYESTSQTSVKVELCLSIYLDEVSLPNAYPVGGNLDLTVLKVTRIKSANTFVPGNETAPDVYDVNQANQEFEWLLVEYLGSHTHDVIIKFYYRAIQNTGGVKNN